MFSEINGQRFLPYGAMLNCEMSTTQTERLLMQENLLLRQSCHQLMFQLDQMTRARDHLNTQYHTVHLLYTQLKHDRNRIARQLTSAQRELEHLKRDQVLTNQIALGHHPLDSYRRKQPSYYRSLKAGNSRSSARRFRRTQSAKYISEEHLPKSTYRRFDDADELNGYPQTPLSPMPAEQQWSPPIASGHVSPFAGAPLLPIEPDSATLGAHMEESYKHPNQIAPLQFGDVNSEHCTSTCSDADCEAETKRPKLVYRDSLRQCVEFSRSLLDLSKRQIVGAEMDDDCNENAATQTIETDQKAAEPLETSAAGTAETADKANNWEQALDSRSVEIVPEKAQMTDKAETSSIALQTQNVEIEEARPVSRCMLECAPIDFDSADSLVVNLSYISDCTTYLREVRLQNKPKDFLGIFFESAFITGVVVQQVVPNSIAARAGIGPGDRVLEICGINMRKANFRLANKIIQECETDVITFKIVSSEAVFQLPLYSGGDSGDPSTHQQSSSSSSSVDTAEDAGFRRIRPLRKTCTLTRREAFKNKSKLHAYFERKHCKEAMLYQTSNLTCSLPRRITVTEPLAKIKLLGGNAVGIFVHSIDDEMLARFLRTGDQLLEYNNFDLRQATAEDAARELAKPARNNGVLVALFNLETYNQIQEQPTGDSFYIRAQFNRTSRKNSLEFKKGDILYVDNTLHDGKPGSWRAWKVDEFGQKRVCGVIPSKYNAQCELLKQLRSQNYGSKWQRFKLFSIPYRILFWRTKAGYTKLNEKQQEKNRILASCTVASYSPLENSIDESESGSLAAEDESGEGSEVAKSYQLVDMLPLQNTPRPVLIYGPFSHLIAQRLESEFPHLYRQCLRQSLTLSTETGESDLWREHYLHCTTAKDTTVECIALADITETVEEGLHPVISVVANTIADFRSHHLFPIVVGLKFRSAKHIKETVNKWKITENRRAVCYKQAKTSYNHQIKCEHEFKDATDIRITGNNLTFMCTQIKDRVREEQNKVVWKEAEQ